MKLKYSRQGKRNLGGRVVNPYHDPISGEYYISKTRRAAVKVLEIESDEVVSKRRVHVIMIYARGKKLDFPYQSSVQLQVFRVHYPYLSQIALPNNYDC